MENEAKYLKIANKLEKNDYETFKNLIMKAGLSKELIKKIDLQFANRFLTITTQDIKTKDDTNSNNIVESLYSDDLKKIYYVISNQELLKKISGLKIMISGETGTGKTTLAKKLISKLSSSHKIWEFKPENLVSSKMGQTQLNIIKLSSEIINASKTQKVILFIDEVDSILSSRMANNDVAEFQRVTSSFIKMLDELNENVLVIFLTNIPDKIDSSIIRRMNFHVKSKTSNIMEFLNWIESETRLDLTTQQRNLLKKFFEKSQFSVSELGHFINSRLIDQNMEILNKDFTYFTKHFLYKKPFIDNPSKRLIDDLKAEGINEI